MNLEDPSMIIKVQMKRRVTDRKCLVESGAVVRVGTKLGHEEEEKR